MEREPESAPHLAFQNGIIQTTIDLRSYRLTAVQKTAYRYADRCTAILGASDQQQLPVTFLFPPSTVESAAREAVRQFFQELLDQELREQIGSETHAIRSLLLAHAFSKTDLIRRD